MVNRICTTNLFSYFCMGLSRNQSQKPQTMLDFANLSASDVDPFYDPIVDAIEKEQCVLFLGPGVTINFSKPSYLSDSMNAIGKAFDKSGTNLWFNHRDGLYAMKEPVKMRAKIIGHIRMLQNQDFTNPLLEKLADIPFHLIVSVTPDLTMQKVFSRRDYYYKSDFFGSENSQTLRASKKKALIYNLFGSVENDDTLIISFSDMFRYIQTINSGTGSSLKTTLNLNENNTRQIIFLGFEFEKWYYQLLLHVLNLDCNKIAFSDATSDDRAAFEKDLKIEFVDTNMHEFVENLHTRFQTTGLRQAIPPAQRDKEHKPERIKDLIDEAFNADDLLSLCQLYYPKVHNDFLPGKGKSQVAGELFDLVQRERKFDELLALIKEKNEAQYNRFEPYYEYK